MSEPRYWGIVPAAGVGRRMGAAVPKQYLTLAGRKVIEHALERLLSHPVIERVYVALGEQDGWWDETEFAGHPDVVRVSGGAERAHSVLNALEALQCCADPVDWVLVHDAARPCVRSGDIHKLIGSLQGHPVGGLLGMPVHDTVKRTDAKNAIQTTVDRTHLWRACTPQMFHLAPLVNALRGALAAGVTVTDEASAIEWAGERPLMVEGCPDNIKITHPEDLELAAFYLTRQKA